MWENQAEQKFVAILESIYEEYVVLTLAQKIFTFLTT